MQKYIFFFKFSFRMKAGPGKPFVLFRQDYSVPAISTISLLFRHCFWTCARNGRTAISHIFVTKRYGESSLWNVSVFLKFFCEQRASLIFHRAHQRKTKGHVVCKPQLPEMITYWQNGVDNCDVEESLAIKCPCDDKFYVEYTLLHHK